MALPPITLWDVSNMDCVFLPIARSISPFTLLCLLSCAMSIEFPSAQKKSTTSRDPFVIVPVLSLKRIFNEPAVSIPSAFLTRTLWSSILLVFCMSTSEIISGSPSGTAQTIITTASETASTTFMIISGIGCAKYPAAPPSNTIIACAR